jgi:hypothetical protein
MALVVAISAEILPWLQKTVLTQKFDCIVFIPVGVQYLQVFKMKWRLTVMAKAKGLV